MAGKSIFCAPGYAEAVERERLIRDSAFLELSEDIAGFEVRPMTLRHYLVLRLAGSPFIREDFQGDVTPEHVAVFLWLLSPKWTVENSRHKRRLLRRCRRFCQPSLPWFPTQRTIARWGGRSTAANERLAAAVKAIRGFVSETMLDRPPSAKGYSASYYSDVCFWWGFLGRSGYPMTRDQCLDTPLKILFQCLRETTEAEGGALSNRSDGKKAEYLQRLNAELAERKN